MRLLIFLIISTQSCSSQDKKRILEEKLMKEQYYILREKAQRALLKTSTIRKKVYINVLSGVILSEKFESGTDGLVFLTLKIKNM